ncbi:MULTISPECIES: TM1266 family iron-only hydrogenase system putative regulator [unclassified Clostridium]|uniref:TM1266 family iron-only hydrogenase system putative regulator n=1 Tax=unclassified Clostridium TaxID=2614128 RepID=UPI0011065F6F|nr:MULTISPECIES: TM1266 family iron-only hydrogenase system putative regulator [unclassified Clostridium]
MATRIALIGIIVEDMDATEQLNGILHAYSPYIIGRMGIPYRQKGVSIISVAVDAENDVISSLSGKLGQVKGLSVKTIYSKAQGAHREDER